MVDFHTGHDDAASGSAAASAAATSPASSRSSTPSRASAAASASARSETKPCCARRYASRRATEHSGWTYDTVSGAPASTFRCVQTSARPPAVVSATHEGCGESFSRLLNR